MLKTCEPMTVFFGPMTVFQKYCHFRCTLVFLEQNSFLCLKNLWKKVFWAFFDKKIDQIWANDGISKIGRKLMTVFQNTVNSNVPSCFCSNDPKTKPMWYMQWRYFQNVWRYIWELALKTFNVPSRKKKYCQNLVFFANTVVRKNAVFFDVLDWRHFASDIFLWKNQCFYKLLLSLTVYRQSMTVTKYCHEDKGARGPRGIRLGFVRGPLGIRLRVVRGSFRIRSGSQTVAAKK